MHPSRTPAPLRRALLAGAALLAAASPAAFAQAPAYPSKPITIVVGYPPGGSTDTAGRLLAIGLYKRLFPTSTWLREVIRLGTFGALRRFDLQEGGPFRWPAATPWPCWPRKRRAKPTAAS